MHRNLKNRCTKTSIRFQRQPEVEPKQWNAKKVVKFKFNLPGEDDRVKQRVLRLCPTRAHFYSSKREEKNSFLKSSRKRGLGLGVGF